MAVSGLSYSWPRMPDERRVAHADAEQEAIRDTPRRASSAPAAIAIASRAQMLAMPVATGMRRVPARSSAAFVNASRPSASGIQIAP